MNSWFRRGLEEIALTGPPRPVRRFDWLITALLAVLAAVEIAFVGEDALWIALELAAAAVVFAVLPFRRQRPFAVPITAFATQCAYHCAAVIDGVPSDGTLGVELGGVMLLYALCRWLPTRLVGIGLVIALGSIYLIEIADGDGYLAGLAVVIPWLLVVMFALSMRYRATLIAQRSTEIRLAERNALARELHDTVAHHVSAIAVQAQAAQFVATSDPAAATAAVANIEQIANTTLDEMRRMVGILRSDQDHDRTVASTSLTDLLAGGEQPPVNITGHSDLSQLTAPVAAAVYRIAQESITNARRHSRGGTFIDVDLAVAEDHVALRVVNDGTPTQRNTGGGYGLVGMQERAEALGGSITTGPRPASGWEVEALIPSEPPS